MLYDVLPPLFLFGSFGGIILLVSRVVLRIRSKENITALQREYRSKSSTEAGELIHSGRTHVSLISSRLVVFFNAIRQSLHAAAIGLASIKNLRKNLHAARSKHDEQPSPGKNLGVPVVSVKPPKSLWRDRLARIAHKGGKQAGNMSSTMVRRSIHLSTFWERGRKKDTLATAREIQKADPGIQSHASLPTMSGETGSPGHHYRVEEKKSKDDGAEKKINISVETVSKAPVQQKHQKHSPIQEARSALEHSNLDEAEDVLVPYIIRHAHDSAAYLLLGGVAERRGDWQEAVEIYQQVLKINRSQHGVRAALGHAAFKAGKLTLALQSLQKAHDEDPTNILILEELLKIAQRMDNRVLKQSFEQKIASLSSHISPVQAQQEEFISTLEHKGIPQ